MKHFEVGTHVGGVRIEEGTIPIEEDRARGKSCAFHEEEIVPEKRDSAAVVAFRENIVAAEREIVEAGRVTAPAWRVRCFRANDVGCGAHLDAAHSHRPLDERPFQFDGGPRLELSRGKEIDATRADVAGYKSDGHGLDHVADT